MFKESPTTDVREGSATDREALSPFDAWILEASSAYDRWLIETYRHVKDGE